MGFFNNFFGAAKQVRYGINSFFGYGALVPKWSALEAQGFYGAVPELRAIIDSQAAMYSKINFVYYDKNGNIAPDPAKELFSNPNPFQDPTEFEALSHKIYNLHGIVFFYVYSEGSSGSFGIKHIYPLSPADMEFMQSYKGTAVIKWSDLFTEIKAILPYTNGQQVKLNKENLFYIADSNVSINKALTGNDKIESARKSLSNLLAVLESENVILNERGAIGIYSPKPTGKNDYGDFSFADEKQQKAFDEKLKTFGTLPGQSKYLVAGSPYDFQRTVLTPTELALDESQKRNAIAICNVWQHSILLLNYLESSTFDNMNAVKAGMYENTIIPVALKFADFKTANFAKDGGKYMIDISDIESLKADNKITADTNNAIADFIIKLNKEVQAGILTYEIAVYFLVSQSNYEQKEAELLINKTVKEPNNGQQ